jgi:hypothetical protein
LEQPRCVSQPFAGDEQVDVDGRFPRDIAVREGAKRQSLDEQQGNTGIIERREQLAALSRAAQICRRDRRRIRRQFACDQGGHAWVLGSQTMRNEPLHPVEPSEPHEQRPIDSRTKLGEPIGVSKLEARSAAFDCKSKFGGGDHVRRLVLRYRRALRVAVEMANKYRDVMLGA